METQFRASACVTNAYPTNDYGSNNVNRSNSDFYSDTEANQDFAREQLRFNAAQSPVNHTASYRSNNASIASQPPSAQTFTTFSLGNNAAPLSINAMGVMAIAQPTLANATPDLQPDGVYVDDNGTRHFRVNISHESRPDPITQFKAAIQDRLDQWGADAVVRNDDVSLAIGGALTALNEVVVPNSSVDLAIGLAAGPVLGKGLAWGMRGLELAASRTALTSWLAADITKVPGAVSQAFAGPIDAALRTGKESISELGRTAAEMAENWMINQGGVLRTVETEKLLLGNLDNSVNQIKTIGKITTITAEEANAPFIAKGWSSPYDIKTRVRVFTTAKDVEFLRFSTPANEIGAFLVRPNEIRDMTSRQIQQYLALPVEPTQVATVSVPAGTKMQVGKIAAQPQFGAPNKSGFQYQLLSEIPHNSFSLPRPIK